MHKPRYANYCDKTEQLPDQIFHTMKEHGKALFSGVAYPTLNSRSAIACGRALGIARDSFLRRPSIEDIAMNTIGEFINRNLYILQEPDKEFLCSMAVLYVFKGVFRISVSGNSRVLYFNDGRLVQSFTPSGNVLFGQSLRDAEEAFPPVQLSNENFFLFLSASQDVDIEKVLEKVSLSQMVPEGEEVPLSLEMFSGINASVSLLELPERKGKRPF